jgi:amino acid transporter
VVFCDIGTSVYYTPGILYHRVGNLAPFFVALVTLDYFLTSSISSVSGFAYLASIFPVIKPSIELLSCLGIGLLCLLNIVGIRESATVALVMAIASLATSLVTARCLRYRLARAG